MNSHFPSPIHLSCSWALILFFLGIFLTSSFIILCVVESILYYVSETAFDFPFYCHPVLVSSNQSPTCDFMHELFPCRSDFKENCKSQTSISDLMKQFATKQLIYDFFLPLNICVVKRTRIQGVNVSQYCDTGCEGL